MAKKKKNTAESAMPAGLNAMHDLHKLMGQQDFKSKEDIEAFLRKMQKEGIPEFEPGTPEEEAEEMVLEGFDMPPAKAAKQARKALEMDPDCIPAFELLGHIEECAPVALAFYQAGVAIGGKRFMGEYRDKNEGHFWGLTETRPFMRCMERMADLLFWEGHMDVATMLWNDMLKLNPNDNQGVRYYVALMWAAAGEAKEYKAIEKQFGDDATAAAAFTRALHLFTTKGPGPQATKALQEAMKKNAHIVPMLLLPDPPLDMPYSYMLGSPEEALNYGYFGHVIWHGCPAEAIGWLRTQV